MSSTTGKLYTTHDPNRTHANSECLDSHWIPEHRPWAGYRIWCSRMKSRPSATVGRAPDPDYIPGPLSIMGRTSWLRFWPVSDLKVWRSEDIGNNPRRLYSTVNTAERYIKFLDELYHADPALYVDVNVLRNILYNQSIYQFVGCIRSVAISYHQGIQDHCQFDVPLVRDHLNYTLYCAIDSSSSKTMYFIFLNK